MIVYSDLFCVDSAELMLPPPPPGGAEETNRPKGPAIPAVTTRVVLLKVSLNVYEYVGM